MWSSSRAPRSCPIGFSTTIRACSRARLLPIRWTIVGKAEGRRGAVEEPPAVGAKVGVEGDERSRSAEGVRVVERRGDVGELSRERLPASVIQPMARELLDPAAGALAERRVVEAAAAEPTIAERSGRRPS